MKLDEESDKLGCEVYKLGTGKGTPVLEMVAAFEKVSGKKIPLVLTGRRPGDAEIVYAATAKAEKELKWKAKYGDVQRSVELGKQEPIWLCWITRQQQMNHPSRQQQMSHPSCSISKQQAEQRQPILQ